MEAGTSSHSLFAIGLKELDFLLCVSGECGEKDISGWCEDGGKDLGWEQEEQLGGY